MEHPYSEQIKDGFYIRKFDSKLSEFELKWHWDEEDRVIICENDTDWQFQMDNDLPFVIKKNTPIFVNEGQYHRLIKGTGDLTVKIKKIKPN